jgi:uncharacterized repeat protein (TIGR01451 family)
VKTGTNPEVYTWKCGGLNGGTDSNTCTASYTATTPPGSPSLTIKKYVKDIATGDTQTAPLAVAPGETFNYYYTLENTSTTAAKNVVVKDTFPMDLVFAGNITVQNAAGTDVTADWNCVKWTYLTTTRPTLVCTKKTDLSGNSGLYRFTVPVTLSLTATLGTNMQNVVYACSTNNTTNNPTGPNGEDICGPTVIDNPPPPPPPGQCDKTNPTSQKDPACIVVGNEEFDLKIKKYIGATEDADSAPGVSKSTNEVFNYQIVVTNMGPGPTRGTTTVRDIFPAGVVPTTLTPFTAGNWSCAYIVSTETSLVCTSSAIIAKTLPYDTIIVPVRVTATSWTTVKNIASVDNPSEKNRCTTDGSALTNSSAVCNKDSLNSDPAYFNVSSGGGGSGPSHVGKVCTNGVAACTYFNSIIECKARGLTAAQCYDANATGLAQCQAQTAPVCTGPGGPGSNTPGGNGWSGGSCGDGIVGSTAWEECDLGKKNLEADSACSNTCKVKRFTNPGANPILDIWMTIPNLAGITKLGMSPVDAYNSKLPFNSHRLILGQGTNAFSIADKVSLWVKTEYKAPIILLSDKRICLSSTGNALNSQMICTTAGRYFTNATHTFTSGGKQYIVIGEGDYLKNIGGSNYELGVANNTAPLLVFKWADQYKTAGGGTITLASAFLWEAGGNDGDIHLGWLYEDTEDYSSYVEYVKLPVRTSSAIVGTTATPVNRSIQNFVDNSSVQSFLASFISPVRNNNSLSSSTTTATSSNSTANLNVNTTVSTSRTVSTIADLEALALNGNKNILAINGGTLTIENCGTPANKTLEMTGVRTILVENANLIIKCNNKYADASSSWAFIVKDGNIQVSSGVTNLAWVYVAIDTNASGDGKLVPLDGQATNNILRIDGSIYGNAEDLFKSRLYARGTNAYDILTTGTVISYSNRALVSPPPLLSQYLNNYSVQRVVK